MRATPSSVDEGLKMQTEYRGSRKHVIDWTNRPTFPIELLELVAPVDCKLTRSSRWMPQGVIAPQEARLETFGPQFLESDAWRQLRQWWLVHEQGANTPNWDIAAGCEIEGRQGLILVEAKANVAELGLQGKPSPAADAVNSLANHTRISEAIADACAGLARVGVETSITSTTHYQLSNRLAFTWKLASLGIPTVLVYLGFLGDDGIRDVSEPLNDHNHWQSTFTQYAQSIVPVTAFEKRIDCGGAAAWFLVRSRQVIQSSPSRTSLT
jgi:hypothetical protein